ncbi:MAG TPA: TolC family protein, partial [Planctomycetota bacterium]|nr:TolC family protein [Planctomycetota bacterium]
MAPPARSRCAVTLLAAAAALGACKGPVERKIEADQEVYSALGGRRVAVPEVRGSLDVDDAEEEARPLRGLKRVVLDVEEALRIAAVGSREYRDRREEVYLVALRYTAERHAFESQFALGGSGDLVRTDNGGTAGATVEGSASRQLERGGAVVLRLAQDFLRAFTGDPVEAARSILSLDLFLPLVRGAGVAARENLTQAELDVLYALRSWARYQQEFVVDLASAFYRVVEARDTLSNEEVTYGNLVRLYDRAKAFGPEQAGRLPDFEVDQARQNVLRADQRRVAAKEALERSIDDLKLFLGLPMSVEVVVREDSLDGLRAAGLPDPSEDQELAVATALLRRLDLLNARDQEKDAIRKVEVAANGLGPDVNLRLGGELLTPGNRAFDFTDVEALARAGIDVDLPIERTAERNVYRAALILAQRAHRAVEGLEDDIAADVKQSWRTVGVAKTSYRIQEEGVTLAARRVESADLNFKAGNAEVRDVL